MRMSMILNQTPVILGGILYLYTHDILFLISGTAASLLTNWLGVFNQFDKQKVGDIE